MKEDKKKKSQKKWMYLFVAAVVCILVGAHFYVHYIRDCLMSQTISNVETVTHQQQQAFDSFVRRDRERIHSYADDFSRHDSGDQESIRSKLDVFAEVDALYTVVNLETGEYYNSKSQEVHRMKEAELEEYRKFSGSGLREPYTGLFTDTKMFGYYECFTFADGARGLFQKGYESDRVSEEFTLSFYGGQGYAYIINRQGDVLMRPFVREEDGVGDNIFEMLDNDGKNGEKAAFLKEELGRNESGSVLFHDQEKEYVYTYTPIESVDGWYLMSIVSEGAIMDEADRVISNSQIIIVIALTIMVTLTVFLFFMWRVRRDLLQKEKEKEYKEQQFGILAKYLGNNTDDAYIMLKDDKRSIEYVSPNFERVLGIRAESAPVELKILEYVEGGINGRAENEAPGEAEQANPEEKEDKWLWEAVSCALIKNEEKLYEKESLKSIELERIDPKTGERRWFRETIYSACIQGERKIIVYVSDRTRDREVQKNLETALIASREANQAKSTFLSSVSHDIRTPMNAIIGLVTLLQQEADDPKTVIEYAKQIDTASQHLLGLINDVLDMNKIESGKVMLNAEELDLVEVIEGLNSIIRPQVNAKGQTMQIYTSGFKHEHLIGDKMRINQILINILSNAVKYTQEGGRIEVTISELPEVKEGYSRIQFRIKDNGQGMSEEYQKVIFDPFTREQNTRTNKIQGTGLGMAITSNLVELMGGTIKVESTLGEGSVFTVVLQLRTRVKEEEPDFWKKHGVKRIIVADNDEDICENVVHSMAGTGVTVDYVTDGEEVMPLVRQAKEKGEPYDLMLLDWKMPKLSGVEVARLIRKNYPHKLPILVFTAYDWTDIEKEAFEAGVDHFMPKPFFLSRFQEAIRRVMYQKPGGEAAAPEPDESAVKGKHILVVEDIEVNRLVLVKILKTRGATCDIAKDGQEAVEMFEKSDPGEYDMILMDVQMPVMNGYQATREIRKGNHPCGKTVPIIAMTANAFADDVRDALEAGMDAHVAKPIILANLEKTIREVLEEKEKEQG